MKATLLVIALGIAGASGLLGVAQAQVAGSTTVGVAVTEMNQVALGWSARKSILGKTVYNEHGDKVGKVDDLIVAPDKNVSYLIIGAGGFIGIGRHDVAIPVSQIREQGGRIVLPGATKEVVKAMPQFDYASDTAKRDQFVAKAGQEIAKAKGRIADIEKKASAVSGEARTKLDQQVAVIKQDLKPAEEKLAELSHATASKWKQFEGAVNKALLRVQQSVEKATG